MLLIVILISLFLYYGGISGISQSIKQGENDVQSEVPSFSLYENQSGAYLNVTNNFDEPITVSVDNSTANIEPHNFATLKLNKDILESKVLPLQVRYLNATLCFNVTL
ncbi:hypothetical protein [Sulfuracidifex tepidarius]|uniref:hypothetical protein n=1 Tax=Sulfuracidifex tepidarius TaxID=1294262 RepID=UPI001C47EA74|nr:hypothetical protein [Sulfuracidifex tepidarius]